MTFSIHDKNNAIAQNLRRYTQNCNRVNATHNSGNGTPVAAKRRIAVQMELVYSFKRHTGVFAGIHDYAQQQDNWSLIIDEWADRTLPARAGKASPFDGLVGRISPLGARRARRLGVPAVNVHFGSAASNLAGVYSDYAECGRLRAEHLLARGFQNFGVLQHEKDRASQVEGDVFEQVVREADCDEFSKIVLDVDLNENDGSTARYKGWQRAMRMIDRWMDTWHPPIGLYLQTEVARLVIEKCVGRGWRVPEDVAIVAGWNEEAICERPAPSITSLELRHAEVGYEAARLLDRMIDEKQKRKGKKAGEPKPETILLRPVGIVARRSTDFYAVTDELVRQALRFMDANLHERLDVDKVANAVAVSRRTLESRFRNKLNRTIAAEIQRLRIERTKRELTGTSRSVQQIARQVGFNSTRTMQVLFRNTVGCTPAQFRRQGGHGSDK